MSAERTADIEDLLDRPFGSWRLLIFLLCGVVMAIEGFDMYMLGSIVPALAAGLGVAPPALASVFVAQGIGLALGYTLIAPLADRFGRRPLILLCVLGFGLITLATTQARSLEQVAGLRFAAFLFFGGIMPNIISLIAEMAALRIRSRQVVLLNACFALGAALGSLIAPMLVANFGWQGAFWAGGIAPLALLPLLFFLLPESARFLVVKGRPVEEVRKVLRPIVREAGEIARFTTKEPSAGKIPIAAIFSDGRLANTLLFMLAGGMMMLVGNLVASWAPTYWHFVSGFEMREAAALFATSSLGAIVWPFAMIVLIPAIGLQRAVILCYALGAVSMLIYVIQPFTAPLAIFLAVTYGAFVVGAISGLYALIAAAYPTHMRATALGWTSGIGRLLAITGPAIGGYMLASQQGPVAISLAFAIPLAIAGLAIAAVRLRTDKA
ncbi:MAG: MFS transporter [Hyphomonadaceae bacterium]|nr:MFS transporter [Hyphomonadaceae bacterium]